MSHDETRFPRRDFLGQCVAVPLVAGFVAAAEPDAIAAESVPPFTFETASLPEADLVREVESLLKFVDPRVRFRHVPLEPSKNAWPLCEQAIKVRAEQPDDEAFAEGLSKLFEERKDVSDEVRKRIVDWVAQNQECDRLADQAIELGHLEFPRASKSVRLALAMDEIGILRDMARVKHAACGLKMQSRDIPGALNDAISIVRLGEILNRSEGMVVDLLVASAIIGMGSETALTIAMSRQVSEQQALQILEALRQARLTQEDFKRALRTELCGWFVPCVANFPARATPSELANHMLADDVDPDFKPNEKQLAAYRRLHAQITRLLDGHPRPFDKPATVKLSSDIHVKIFREMDKPWLQRKTGFFEPLQQELAAWPKEINSMSIAFAGFDEVEAPAQPTDAEIETSRRSLMHVDNVFGKYLFQSMIGIVSTPFIELHQARLEAARLRIALRVYESRHGKLPATLAGLVDDKLLPEVPRDPFDGKPFRYSAERRVIWSVNQSGKNEGLIPEQADPDDPFAESSELTWRIPPV